MNTVRYKRKKLGLTQAQLAAEIDVDQPTISRVEHGFRLTDPDKQQALEMLLDRAGD